jgi:cholesterol transport system auxiliary component
MKLAPRRALLGALIALGVTMVSSCALLSPAKVETSKEVLNKLPPDLPRRETRAATLLVFPPESKPIHGTTQMAYTTQTYQLAYFSQHEWADTPSRMLHPLLVGTLENTHAFKAVLTPPHPGRYGYALRTEILDLIQDFTSEPATLRLSLRVQLSDGASNRVIATKEISLREPMRQRTPYAGVVAANDAVAKALRELAEFVIEKTD